LADVTYPNGQTTTYGYFDHTGDDRLKTIHHKYANASTLSKFDYTYDMVGNILTWQRQAGSSAPTIYRYTYDLADELVLATKWTTDQTPVVLKRYAYAYDKAGNRTSEQIDDALTGATYDAMNRLMSQQAAGGLLFSGAISEPATVTVGGTSARVNADNSFSATVPIVAGTNTVPIIAADPSGNVATKSYQVTGSGSTTIFTYDGNGNMTSDGARTFEWDARNQLVTVTSGTHRSEFTYNGLRRRVRVVEKENGVTQSDTRVLWCESDICEERGADGTTVTRRVFVYGEQIAGVVRFFAHDHLGSVTEVLDGANVLLGTYSFDPWGRRTLAAGADVTTVGYTGLPTEGNLSLTLNRTYDADVGRWLSEDPMGLSDGPNLFSYVSNRAIIWTDPLGLQACCDQLKRRRVRLHQILDQLEARREPSGAVGGMTVCAGFTPDPLDVDFIRRTNPPCLWECSIAHENRHAQQCRRFGAEHIGRNSMAMERSAYLVELGCIIRTIQSSGCEACN
jgi:RHS repeat-associated protein